MEKKGKFTELISKAALKREFTIQTEEGEVLDTRVIRIIDRQPIQEAITISDLLELSRIIYDDDGIGHKVVEIKDIIGNCKGET